MAPGLVPASTTAAGATILWVDSWGNHIAAGSLMHEAQVAEASARQQPVGATQQLSGSASPSALPATYQQLLAVQQPPCQEHQPQSFQYPQLLHGNRVCIWMRKPLADEERSQSRSVCVPEPCDNALDGRTHTTNIPPLFSIVILTFSGIWRGCRHVERQACSESVAGPAGKKERPAGSAKLAAP